MYSQNIFLIAVLVASLIGVVSCQEAEQKPAALVASEESVAAEREPVAPVEVPPAPAPVIVKAPQEPAEAESAAEPPVEVQADQIGPEEEVIISYGDKKLTMRHIEYLQPKADAKTIKKIADWWLTTQLLAEEAAKRGVTQDPAVRLRADLRAKQKRPANQRAGKAELHARNLEDARRVAASAWQGQGRRRYCRSRQRTLHRLRQKKKWSSEERGGNGC